VSVAARPLTTDLLVPQYDTATLADVLSASADAIGVPGVEGHLRFRPVPKVTVLLVDGLGAEQLRANAAHAPFLTEAMAANGQAITAGFPTTTITSLASLGVGAPAGVHGMTGYQVRVPSTGRILNALQWDWTVEPREWQPHQTLLQRAASDGVAVTCVAPPEFAGSGLTIAALRGGEYVGAVGVTERLDRAHAAQRRAERTMTYVYWGDVDRRGHMHGVDSPEWRTELSIVDAFVAQLAATVPDDGLLVVTADHGMVDIDQSSVVDVAAEPALRAAVEVLAGEGRCRYVHARPGAAADVLAMWQDVLDPDEFLVLSRDEVVAAQLLGPVVTDTALQRVGDVVVLARRAGAVFATGVDSPQVMALVGQHGSLTADELLVPLITIYGAA
jgi:hypothetical protein